MELIEVPVEQALGGILVHTMRVGGRRLRKGHVLAEQDLKALADLGIAEVTVARLGPDDADEDEAARDVSRAAAGDHVTLSPVATGRCNLRAAADGIVMIDVAAIHAANRCCEGITIATADPHGRAAQGQTIATCKIIPMAVPRPAVAEVVGVLKAARSAVSVAPFRIKTAALIQTVLPGVKDQVLKKTVAATRTRVESLGGKLIESRQTRHRCQDLSQAVSDTAKRADIVLVIGASAIADRGDVAPQAIEAAGGRVEHFGMPVDPGNLTLLGRIGTTAVLVLPGSFRSPRLHGCDWLLWRLFADLPVGTDDIAAMGVGGLLKDIPGRPLPRDRAVQPRR